MEEITLFVEGQYFEVKKDVLCKHSDYFRAMFSGSFVENEQREIEIDSMDEVTLFIEGHAFKARKDVLCEHSDYFRAMFSGSYVENEQMEVNIDIVDARSMRSILQYMENALNLVEFSISEISQLAITANFLQITELVRQIEETLYDQLSASNWLETITIAEQLSSTKLKHLSAAFGLLSFKCVKPEYITSIENLYSYLSHPYLKVERELDVFKFGLQWISQIETEAKSEWLQIILCCLEVKKLTANDLKEIKTLIRHYEDSLAGRVVDCLYEISSEGNELSLSVISDHKVMVCDKFTERVYDEIVNLVTESKMRQLAIIATMPVWTCLSHENQPIDNPESASHFMYAYTESGFNEWLEIPLKNVLGWRVTAWGLTKLVLVCGKYYGKSEQNDNEIFMKDVMVYDTLTKKWTTHGVELPSRENGEVTVLGDSLYIIGGRGVNRDVLDSAIIYDLKLKTFRDIAKFPITKQYEEPPVLCVHENMVYGAAYKDIYRFEDTGGSGRWVNVVKSMVASNIRISSMVSYGGYIYCTLRYFQLLFRFKPGVHKNLQDITDLNDSTVALCNSGNRLLAFTIKGESERLTIEGFTVKWDDVINDVLWSQAEDLHGTTAPFKPHKNAGCCALVVNLPPLNPEVPDYHKKYLVKYCSDINDPE